MSSANMSISDKIGGITITDGDQFARLDRTTGVLMGMTYEHHEIHAGSFFTAAYAVDLANAAVHGVIIQTPDTTAYAHMAINVWTESEAEITVYEGATVVANGTAVVAYNRSRNSTKASTTLVYHTPNTPGTVGATAIHTRHWGSGRGEGGEERGAHEWILKRNTKYYFTITNATANANYITWELDWYEHTDKDVITLVM